jgi:phosphotransferase system HPr (HPr) family protein
MNEGKVSRQVVVNNPQGIHARPADLLVRLAKQFQSKIELVRENQRVDAKSILELLTLGAVQGTALVLEAEGPDAEQALSAIAELFAANFAENESNQNQSTSN